MQKWPMIEQGDLEGALIKILTDAPEISGFAGGAPNVSSTLRDYVPGDRWITISHEGGTSDWPKIANARIDVNVFANTRTDALRIAQKALGVLIRETGQPSPAHGVRTLKLAVETGLIRADDKFNDKPRYLFSLRIAYVPYGA